MRYASLANVFVNNSVLVCYNLFLCGCKIFCGSHHGETRGGEVLAVAGDDDLGILGQGRKVLEGILKVGESRVECLTDNVGIDSRRGAVFAEDAETLHNFAVFHLGLLHEITGCGKGENGTEYFCLPFLRETEDA